MSKKYRILTINVGSTSTKLAMFENEECIIRTSLPAEPEMIRTASDVFSQLPERRRSVRKFIAENALDMNTVDMIASRGGCLPPCKGGAYAVNKLMVDVLRFAPSTVHASNLSAILGEELAKEFGIPHIIYDSVSADEMSEIAKISGMPEISNNTGSHVLNPRAAGIWVCEKELGIPYKSAKLIVAHLGGGISVTAHLDGKIVDYTSDYNGPMAPERSGRVPCAPLTHLCYSGKYSESEMYKKISGGGGLVAHLGTADALEIEKRIKEGDTHAKLIYEAMLYQICKNIGEMVPVFCGTVDAVVLTGSLTYSNYVTSWIQRHIDYIAPVKVVVGDRESEALAGGALRVLTGKEDAKEYGVLPDDVESTEEFYRKYTGK